MTASMAGKTTDNDVGLISVLSLLGSDALKENIDEIITSVLPNVTQSEENLDIKSLDILHSALKLKARLRHGGKLDYRNILNQCLLALKLKRYSEEHMVSKLLNVLQQTVLLLEGDLFHHCLGYIIKECKQDLAFYFDSVATDGSKMEPSFTPQVNLRILETVFNILIIKEDIENDPEVNNFRVPNDVVDNDMHDLMLKLVLCHDMKLSSETTVYVIPKFLHYYENNVFLNNLWNHLVKNLQNEAATELSHILQVLCVLAEFYLPAHADTKGRHNNLSIVKENDFWLVIQNGLIQHNPLLRKQALYLTKRAIGLVSHTNCFLKPSNADSLFWWEPSCSKKIWEQFFLIIETLEEKQVHIIIPVLPVVDFLADLCATPCNKGLRLHESWMLCVFHRIINHDSNAIIKWGITNFVPVYKKIQFSSQHFSNFLDAFLNAVNQSSLYMGSTVDSGICEIGTAIADLFQAVVKSPLNECRAFFCCLLCKMINISWAPVPLFNVTRALASTSITLVWDNEELKLIKSFITEALGCQYVFIRAAIQCMLLDAVIHLVNYDSLDIYVVADLLGSFRETESLKRGTSAWNSTVQWLKTAMSKEDAARFVSTSIDLKMEFSAKAVARMIVLLCDAGLICCSLREEGTSLATSLECILSAFENYDKRYYADDKVLIQSLEIIIRLLKESTMIPVIKTNDDPVRKTVLSCVNSMLDQIFSWITRKMLTVSHLKDYYLVDTCIRALVEFSCVISIHPTIATLICGLQESAVKVILTSSAPPMCMYFSMKVLATVSHCLKINTHCQCLNTNTSSCTIFNKQHKLVKYVVEDGRLNIPPTKESDSKLTRDLQTLWGKMTSEYLEACWNVVADFLDACHNGVANILVWRKVKCIIGDATTSLEIGGRSVLVPVIKVIEKILSHCTEVEDMKDLLHLISNCWRMTFELRKTELFWIAMEAFIQMLFQPFTMMKACYLEHLLQYSEKIFTHGCAVTGLCNLLMVQLQNVVTSSSLDILIDKWCILVDGLTFGPVHRKDQRIIVETCLYIASLGEKCAVNALVSNDCYADCEVRMRALDLVLLLSGSPNHYHVPGKLVDLLIEKDKIESSRKARYYSDSQVHRVKHRVMQGLLILEPLLSADEAEKLLWWVQESLLKESQQPSVRYQQEWLIVRILVHYPHLKEHLWIMFKEAQEKRPGSICSFIAVMYHLANVLSLEEEAFVDRSMSEILPWSMAQHFSIRLYAQTALQKLFRLCQQQNLKDIAAKYAVLEACLKTSVEHGNAVKNAQKLQEDFYFSAFHPMEHYSLETIFHDLPRLANVTEEEWISEGVMKACGVVESRHIKMESLNSSLKQFNVAAWVLKSSGITADEEEASTETGLQNNVQKKLIPWRSLIPDHELRPCAIDTQPKKEGLIIVASLIDRLPNLGGLSRTCEIFGVSEYVIGSLKYVEDKQFKNLSVTAEQWIPISEVKPHLLSKYIEHKKKDGYAVIGAEQTANSIRLNDMKFPKKTLLLLGNEKEGIPANLLPLLDVCVEIPQHGIVRSLNVHVTGALFVWEYTRQHLLT